MSLEENNYSRLEELSGSDFEIVDDEPNIIGWSVKNDAGTQIGEVENLLFDPESRKVRYLVVDLDTDYLGLDAERLVLIPIGIADLRGEDVINDVTDREDTVAETQTIQEESLQERASDELVRDDPNYAETVDGDHENSDLEDDENVVIIPNVTADQLLQLPVYEKGKLTPVTETLIRNVFEGGSALSTIEGADFYDHNHFDENRFYGDGKSANLPVIEEELQVGKQEIQTGGARITSRLVERPVEENLTLKEEHVNVERTPVNRPVSDADQAFQESEIEMTEYAEIPVISKEARVVEEVSISKEEEENEEKIRDTVRNTEVDIERIPGEDESRNGFNNNNSNTGSL